MEMCAGGSQNCSAKLSGTSLKFHKFNEIYFQRFNVKFQQPIKRVEITRINNDSKLGTVAFNLKLECQPGEALHRIKKQKRVA